MPAVLTRFCFCSVASFSVGDDACDLGSVTSKWGLCGPAGISHEGSPSLCGVFPSRLPRAALFKTAELTLRLASACTLQGIRVGLAHNPSRRPIRPALALGCLFLRGPLG